MNVAYLSFSLFTSPWQYIAKWIRRFNLFFSLLVIFMFFKHEFYGFLTFNFFYYPFILQFDWLLLLSLYIFFYLTFNVEIWWEREARFDFCSIFLSPSLSFSSKITPAVWHEALSRAENKGTLNSIRSPMANLNERVDEFDFVKRGQIKHLMRHNCMQAHSVTYLCDCVRVALVFFVPS